jgi:hypothetical protein
LKAERRKPSGEKPCDIEDNPSFTGVLAHCRLHQFNAMGHQADEGHERMTRWHETDLFKTRTHGLGGPCYGVLAFLIR